jgi:hypothetical protein
LTAGSDAFVSLGQPKNLLAPHELQADSVGSDHGASEIRIEQGNLHDALGARRSEMADEDSILWLWITDAH